MTYSSASKLPSSAYSIRYTHSSTSSYYFGLFYSYITTSPRAESIQSAHVYGMHGFCFCFSFFLFHFDEDHQTDCFIVNWFTPRWTTLVMWKIMKFSRAIKSSLTQIISVAVCTWRIITCNVISKYTHTYTCGVKHFENFSINRFSETFQIVHRIYLKRFNSQAIFIYFWVCAIVGRGFLIG